MLFYFLIQANLILYGINEIFDANTDQNNPKKSVIETKVTKRKTKLYLISIF